MKRENEGERELLNRVDIFGVRMWHVASQELGEKAEKPKLKY